MFFVSEGSGGVFRAFASLIRRVVSFRDGSVSFNCGVFSFSGTADERNRRADE